MMLNVLIADDEFPARQELKCILEEIGNVEIVGECANGQEALDFLANNTEVDAVFLDVEMPLLDGLAAAQKINRMPDPPDIIFATGFSQFAVQAFEVDGADYVLKPYTKERLELTVSRLVRDKERADEHIRYNSYGGEILVNKFVIWHNDRLLVLNPVKEIMLVKSDKRKKTLFYTKRGVLESNIPLKDAERKLKKQGFLRIHKSYVVNMDKVREIAPWFNDTYLLVVEDCEQEEVPVSRHFIQEFKNALNGERESKK